MSTEENKEDIRADESAQKKPASFYPIFYQNRVLFIDTHEGMFLVNKRKLFVISKKNENFLILQEFDGETSKFLYIENEFNTKDFYRVDIDPELSEINKNLELRNLKTYLQMMNNKF